MIVYEYNSKSEKSTPKEISNEMNISCYENDMNKIINCVNCGKEITFGESYTSRRYFTSSGFGYGECSRCYFGYKED